ncbi:MAG: FHIPEP family type III secretion protein [Candidatus Hodarchaeota archaeon]
MWNSNEIIHVIAEAYHAAALANANMRDGAEALEVLRTSMLEEKNLFKVWDVIEEEIGRAETERLQPALIALRNRFEHQLRSSEIVRLHEVFEQDPQAGWINWLQTYVEGLDFWRLQFCLALCEEPFPFPAQRALDVEKIRSTTKLLIHERWPETYGLFLSLTEQNFIPDEHRAKLLVTAGEIQLYHLMNPDKARELFHDAEELAPNEARVVCGWGEYWLEQKKFEKAMEHFQRGIKIAPKYAIFHTNMGECYENQGDLGTAEEWYQEAIRANRGYSFGYRKLINLYGSPELFPTHRERILLLAERAFAVEPECKYQTYLEIGDIYLQNNEHEQAHQWYKNAISLDGTRLNGYIYRGYGFLEEEDYEQARITFQKAIKVAPEAFDGYWGMAGLYEQQEKWEEALHWYEKSLPRRPEWERTIRGKIGYMRWKLQKYSEAEDELIKALRCEPDNDMVLGILHDLADDYYTSLENANAALRIYEEIRQIKGELYEAQYHNNVGNLKYYYDENEEAADAYRKAIAAEPNTVIYHRNLAGAYRQLKNWDKARDEVEIAFRLDKKDDVYRKEMALIFNAEGNEFYSRTDYENAIEKYMKSIELQPNDAVYYSNLSGAWEDQKISDERLIALENAISSLQKACELDPLDTEYAEILTRLKEKKRVALQFGEQILDQLPLITPIAMEVAGNLISYVKDSKEDELSAELAELVSDMGERIFKEYGVQIPGVRFTGDETDLPDGTYIIMLKEIPIVKGTITIENRLFPSRLEDLSYLEIYAEDAINPLTGDNACWIMQEDWEKVEKAGHELWDVIEYPLRHLESTIQMNLSEFVGHQEIMNILETQLPSIYQQMQDMPADLSALTHVLKGLLKEKVSIAALEGIVEKFNHLRETGTNLWIIIETIRSMPEICPKLPGNNDRHLFYSLGQDFEAMINESINRKDSQPVLVMEPEDVQDALSAVRAKLDSERNIALIVENVELRPFVRELIELEFPHIPVLSRQEWLPGLENNIIGDIELEYPRCT